MTLATRNKLIKAFLVIGGSLVLVLGIFQLFNQETPSIDIDESKVQTTQPPTEEVVVVEEEPTVSLFTGTITSDMTISGPRIIQNEVIIIEGVKNVLIENVTFVNSRIIIEEASEVVIRGSSFSDIKADVLGFIEVGDNVSNLTIENNSFQEITYITSSSTYGSAIKMTLIETEAKNIQILNNTFRNIGGPAAIWIGGHDALVSDCLIEGNDIRDTENFGIEFYEYDGVLSVENVRILNNTIEDIGSIRERNIGNGASAIYNNLEGGDIYASHNTIRRVLEVGIEGYYTEVTYNYIEDTGADQLNHPIDDSAAIYMAGPYVAYNTIVNPGAYGGIHKFSNEDFTGHIIAFNTISHLFEPWQAETAYALGDSIVANDKWYICMQAGTTSTRRPGSERAAIEDGSVVWQYKKPFAEAGININARGGISDVVIANNVVLDMKSFASLSDLNGGVYIEDNAFMSDRLSINKNNFITGYGNRNQATGVIQTIDVQTVNKSEPNIP